MAVLRLFVLLSFLFSFFLVVGATSGPQCLYAADLTLTSSDFSITSDGRILVWNETGTPLFNFTTVPTALAVDNVRDMLYIASIGTVQGLNIAQNLSQESSLCPCSVTNDFSTIRSMVVDETDGGLYVSFRQQICHFYPDQQVITNCTSILNYLVNSSASITHLVIDSERRMLYGAPTDQLAIMVFSLGSSGNVVFSEKWFPLTPDPLSTALYQGLAIGGDGNLFANLSPVNGTVIIEVDINTGALLNRYVASATELSAIDIFYDLAYNPSTDSFYSFFTLISPAEQIIASYTLVSNSNGTFNSAAVTELALYDLSSPLALRWARCPYVGVPSPSPSPGTGGGSDTNEKITISFATVGSVMIVILLIICFTPVVWWMVWRRRRRYYAEGGSSGGSSGEGDEGDVEMDDVKYSYREVDFADLTLGRELGHGAFGRVYRGEYRGAAVAVKMFEGVRLDEADEKTLRELRKEAEMMEKLSNHPNIVKFVGAITQASGGASTFALVTEYCCRGSLYDLLIRKHKKLPLITLVQMARDVALGLLHLHKEHVVHRDVAARNILVGKNYEVYVADFGLARTKAAEARAATTTQTFGPIAWMAPEALQNLEYSEATDAFSFGVLLWEMMARKRPWAGLDGAQIVASVTSNMRPQIPKDCDPMFKSVIKQCWKHNPAKRPSFEQMVKSFVAYHKNLKKVMSFTSDSVDSESDSMSESSDEFELLEGDEQRDPRVRRMQGEIKSLLRLFLADRSDEGSFETVERANLAVLQDLRAGLQRRTREGRPGEDSGSGARMVDTSSGQFTPPSEPTTYTTAALPSDDAVTGYDEVSPTTTDSGYAQVSSPTQSREGKEKGKRRDKGEGAGTKRRGTKKEGREGEEWTVLEQPRRPAAKAAPEGEVDESYLDL